jgi:hypothetical protein
MATKRRKLVFAGVCAGLLLLSFWLMIQRSNDGPEYKGHHLNEWVGALISDADIETDFEPSVTDIREAVRATGSNNIPLLVHWIETDTDNTALNRMFKVLPDWFNQLPIFNGPANSELVREDTARGAAAAFKFLGDKGTNAIPRLTQIVLTGNEPARERALDALRLIGNAAVPSVLSIAATPDPRESPVRFMAIGILSLHTNDITVRTFLAEATNDPDHHVASDAADALRGENSYNY